MDESILLRQVGDRSVMHVQLQRLAAASSLPNVRLQIMPLGSPHKLPVDSFVILEFGWETETKLHDVVSIETLSSQLYFEGEVDTYEFILTFEHLADVSLTPAESRELILRTAHYLDG